MNTQVILPDDRLDYSIIPKYSGFILPILSAFGYLLALVHEAGLFHYYGIPFGLIDLNLTSIVNSIAGTLLAFSFFFIWLVITNKNSQTNALARRVEYSIYSSIALVPFIWLYINNDIYFIIYFIIALNAPLYVIPFFRFPKTKGYLNKLKAEDDVRKGHSKLSRYSIYAVLLSSMLLISAYYSGIKSGENINSYYTIEEYESSIVLKIYEDRYICATLGSNDTIERNYFVVYTSEDAHLKYIGQREISTPPLLSK